MHAYIRNEEHADVLGLKRNLAIAIGYSNKRFMTVFVKDVRNYSILKTLGLDIEYLW